MADQTISLELQINAVDSAKTVADFKTAIDQLKGAIAGAGSSFDGFTNATAKVSDAEGKVNSLTTSISGVANASEKIGTLANIGKNISTGFEAAKSAADLFGASGKELQGILSKIQDTTKQYAGGLINEDTYQKQIAALKTQYLQTQYATEVDYQQKITKTELEQSNIRIANAKGEADEKKKAKQLEARDVESGLSTISSLVSTFADKSVQGQKEAFEINKQISVARALISTYEGANEALNTPLNSVAPGIGIASAAVIVAAGLANVAQIEAQQFNGGSSGSNSSSASAGAPSLQPLVQPTTTLPNKNQDAQNSIQQPLKVFVTESDIRTATNRVDTITNRAVIH